MMVNFQVKSNTELSAMLTEMSRQSRAITFIQTSDPDHGQVVAFDESGAFTYRPDAGFTGTDSFSVSASDGANLVLATITLEVQARQAA